jgi:hypothetical protein
MAKSKNQPKNTKLNKYWWVFALAVILVAFGSFFAYNKYLDQQNVNEMKELLAEFEKLKTTMEEETGNSFYVTADCGVGGEKFNPIYSCTLDLLPVNLPVTAEVESLYLKSAGFYLNKNARCGLLKELGFSGTKEYGNFYTCLISVTKTNQDEAEEIFYKYDTTPGREF